MAKLSARGRTELFRLELINGEFLYQKAFMSDGNILYKSKHKDNSTWSGWKTATSKGKVDVKRYPQRKEEALRKGWKELTK